MINYPGEEIAQPYSLGVAIVLRLERYLALAQIPTPKAQSKGKATLQLNEFKQLLKRND